MSTSDPPDPPQESSLLRSGSPQEQHRLEQLIVNITRGIQACTDNSLHVKTLVESYLNHAIGIIREDLVLTNANSFRRIDELTRAVRGIELGNQQSLGAIQELLNTFRSDSSLSRGLNLQVKDALEKATRRLEDRAQEITERELKIPPVELAKTPSEDDAPIWWNALASDFGKLTWKHKWYIIGVGVVSISPILKAMPSIIDALKLLLGDG